MDQKRIYDNRYIVQLVVEADTPLSVSSGESDLLTDSIIRTDTNGLPIIPGTAMAGVMRHEFSTTDGFDAKKIFGFQDEEKPEISEGSRVVVSSAHVLDEDGKVVEGILNPERLASGYLKQLLSLPVRQHCKINHRGVSDRESHGKFDQEVVPKGVRFKCEIELIGTKEDKSAWEELLRILSDPSFRIGGGTRKGFGKLKIIAEQSQIRIFNLRDAKDLKAYLEKSSSLNYPLGGTPISLTGSPSSEWIPYALDLKPEDLWLFGSGFADNDADMTPVYERVVVWTKGQASFSERKILIPASSVKGAISHRVAFHYNRLKRIFSDQIAPTSQSPLTSQYLLQHTGENNDAVLKLFGCAKDSQTQQGKVGNVIFSDVFVEDENKTKILNHVSIDRFTGGAIDGALFDEKVISQTSSIELKFLVKASVLRDQNVLDAWESALKDVCHGRLPLGGGVMRGHGVFTGSLRKITGVES